MQRNLKKQDPVIELLRQEFSRKVIKNRAYSLRSFARDLKMDASNLSKLLNYQKPIGRRQRSKLSEKLGFSESELTDLAPMASNTDDSSYNKHNFEIFQIVAGRQHYAILELFKLKDFKPTISSIPSKLGITKQVAAESIDRLVKVGLLIQNKRTGELSPVDEASSSILETATSKAHRDQQAEILEGAIEALKNIPIELRSQSSMTMAIDVRNLDRARDLIRQFRRNLGRLLSNSENLSEVYQLSVSLYPITKTKTLGEKK